MAWLPDNNKTPAVIGGVKYLQIGTLLCALWLNFSFLKVSIKKLKANSLFVLLPYLISFNLNQFFLFSHLLPVAIPMAMTIRFMNRDFKFDSSDLVDMFFYGFYWVFFCFLINPILVLSIPAATYVVFSEMNKTSSLKRVKELAKIILLTSTGMVTSVIIKVGTVGFLTGRWSKNLEGSSYWNNHIKFGTAISNTVWANNNYIFLVSVIAVIAFCSSRSQPTNRFFYVLIVVIGLLYPWFLPSHTVHTWASGSAWPFNFAVLVSLRALLNPIIGENSMVSHIRTN